MPSQARKGVVALGREEGEQPTVLKAVHGGRKSRRRLQLEAAEDGGEDVEHVALRTREYSAIQFPYSVDSSLMPEKLCSEGVRGLLGMYRVLSILHLLPLPPLRIDLS
ncbi:hypothetical protein VPH35_078009 [Triticum aestivum]|uniref:Uncharacterized protein n=1 Tax=Aegilops tauschii TaxID=37682 RepID=R7WE76_AEGTA